ncbi:orotidine-5'-phosphate decarboxylase [Clostridium thermosuccinogenes]|jgi:orotidine-5'-phosphate decarboxylase|uniref:Orotidine 5'-phosphate decarboxylase n=1 Tax=Clostridium thermosuccinogenes TaxID=84032 RepID=A0A2K2FIC0_9CLOT|nr:orotidine-5'-phosphate decarboxylase [Pseudoclostridium thermosuccinogenes]AUS96312.1 orotidine-5'-phosphate decarboxylase [Pseudoclostridium thermosuccinogenes]PNT93014.1 orotidine-5'-phosphate decarboxylase [Pseudoclostridium thermosuccinogenes]PNT98526.1 orotidine-5'-phosphate decarboxylase [Pseudoclostridium thermosuccinogenes]PNU00628.1 orotidine-5'-phosphate decarboxylase [Pseudoclostridium thermosuccinogenes]
MFIDTLIDKVIEKNNPSVVGLDPKLEYIPEHIKKAEFDQYGMNLKAAAEAILKFNRSIIDATYDIVPAVKLQLACYEMYGLEGIRVFNETANYAKQKGLLVIADGKRNDIGSTAEAYSAAFLGSTPLMGEASETAFGADALTVNPYLGIDGIKPFLNDCRKYEKGIFVLVKTSNKSSGQIQDLLTATGKSMYEIVAEYVVEWGKNLKGKYGYSSVGAVVGATYPNQAKILRRIMKEVYLLVPGYGAQGGTARDVAHSFNSDGLGALVNASRSIMCAYQSDMWKDTYDETHFAEASRAEAIRMRDEINDAIGKK